MNDDRLMPTGPMSDALCTPRKEYAPQPVKTLRDEFAMAALTGIIISRGEGSTAYADAVAAYHQADAMLKARGEG